MLEAAPADAARGTNAAPAPEIAMRQYLILPALCAAALAGCGSVEAPATARQPGTGAVDTGPAATAGAAGTVDIEHVRRGLTALAHDTMEGRMTGSRGAS
jgi:hypothetical protein